MRRVVLGLVVVGFCLVGLAGCGKDTEPAKRTEYNPRNDLPKPQQSKR
jgi:hypothetical protein